MTHHEKNSLLRTPIGEVVKAWRKVRGFTATELVARAGPPITKGYLTQLEHEKIQRPSDKFLAPLAAALEIPDEYLVLRRLPGEISLRYREERGGESQTPFSSIDSGGQQRAQRATVSGTQSQKAAEDKESGFTFASPLASREQDLLDEEEELQQILAQVEELRRRIKKLIVQKGRQR